MRFKINLASQPYENARRFFMQWGLALATLFIVSGLLVYVAARSWRVSHTLARSIDDERARLDKLNNQEKADIEILNQGQNRDVRERSQALNALILRKGFSWTRIFSDLEKLMPTRLHVTAITPQLTKTDEIQIRMQVGGDSRDKAIELLQNMEKAPDFREAMLVNENSSQKGAGGGDAMTFEITAVYVPAAAAAISEAEKNTASAEQSSDDEDRAQEPPAAHKQGPKPAASKTNAPAPTQNANSATGGRK